MKKIFLAVMSLVCMLFAAQNVQAFRRGDVKILDFYKIIPQIIAGSSGGTGFFIEKNLIVTNFHVIRYAPIKKGLKTVTVKLHDKEYAGTVIVENTKDDTAFIRIREQVGTPVRLGDYSRLKEGDEIITYGHPVGGYKVFRSLVHKVGDDWFSVKGAVAGEGHSGSPMFTRDLEVLGIATSSSTSKPYRTYGTSIDKVEMLLGDIYLAGKGVPLNARLAKNWYLLAASKGSFKAKFEVANLFDTGQRHLFGATIGKLPRDLKQAISIYEDVAANSWHGKESLAQFRLGQIYDRGEGHVSRDLFKAVKFYKQFEDNASRGLDKEQVQAAYRVAQIYEKGEGGIPQNGKEAWSYYQTASVHRHYVKGKAKGIPSLADIIVKMGDTAIFVYSYYYGLGEAKAYYIKALGLSGGNHPEAQRKLENVNRKLTERK